MAKNPDFMLTVVVVYKWRAIVKWCILKQKWCQKWCTKRGALKIILYRKIARLKNRAELEAEYMKMEERDRMIEERGAQNKLRSQVAKKLAKGKSVEEIADDLEEEIDVIQSMVAELEEE